MKYLIAGLGNIGEQYRVTRHNIGFSVLETLALESGVSFEDKRYAFRAELKYKGRIYVLIKRSTYVNLSGNAVRYWMKKENLEAERLLVVTDDIALPFGSIRLRLKGGDGGHNGLNNIISVLGSQEFARLRFGIGNEFNRGGQVDHVLGKWTGDEEKLLPERIGKMMEIIRNFGTIGPERTMNLYNNT
ncbi:MAG: aminoacyl-tRNA hydrolase [Bacteroidota bacterium]